MVDHIKREIGVQEEEIIDVVDIQGVEAEVETDLDIDQIDIPDQDLENDADHHHRIDPEDLVIDINNVCRCYIHYQT